jgi:hypothetical protein
VTATVLGVAAIPQRQASLARYHNACDGSPKDNYRQIRANR